MAKHLHVHSIEIYFVPTLSMTLVNYMNTQYTENQITPTYLTKNAIKVEPCISIYNICT
jgi:hypothetical protein